MLAILIITSPRSSISPKTETEKGEAKARAAVKTPVEQGSCQGSLEACCPWRLNQDSPGGVLIHLKYRWTLSVLRAAQPDFMSICCLYDFYLSMKLYILAKYDFRGTHIITFKKYFLLIYHCYSMS